MSYNPFENSETKFFWGLQQEDELPYLSNFFAQTCLCICSFVYKKVYDHILLNSEDIVKFEKNSIFSRHSRANDSLTIPLEKSNIFRNKINSETQWGQRKSVLYKLSIILLVVFCRILKVVRLLVFSIKITKILLVSREIARESREFA